MNMRKLKFNSVAERIAYKKREAERIRRERELVDEADRSMIMLVWYCLPTLLFGMALITAIFIGGHYYGKKVNHLRNTQVNQERNP